MMPRVRIVRRSRMHRILVEDDELGTRFLQFGDTIQSALRPGPMGDEGLEYIDLFHMPLLLRPRIRRTLFIGLGAGSGPRQFLRDYGDMQIDVVELDPEVVRVATEHFGFEPSNRCRVTVDDGVEYLTRSRRRWDLIVVDAYTTERGELVIPFEMTTAGFFDLCVRRLEGDGILLFNCAAACEERVTRELHHAIVEAFANVLTFALPSGDNTVLIASPRPLEQIVSRLAERGRRMLVSNRLGRRDVLRHFRSLRRDLSGNGLTPAEGGPP